jgi:hypothetical protein
VVSAGGCGVESVEGSAGVAGGVVAAGAWDFTAAASTGNETSVIGRDSVCTVEGSS